MNNRCEITSHYKINQKAETISITKNRVPRKRVSTSSSHLLLSLLKVTVRLFFLGKYSGPTQLLFLSGQLIGYVIAYDDFILSSSYEKYKMFQKCLENGMF